MAAVRKLTFPSFRQPSQVTIGTGAVTSLPDLARLEGAALLVSGEPQVERALTAALAKRDMALTSLRVLRKPPGEPTAASVAFGAAWLAERPFTALVAIGGGSVLDWARLALATSRQWLDPATGVMRCGLSAGDRPPLVLVPTTCGSGAEAAAVAVYTVGGKKLAVLSDAFLADRVVLDARFLTSSTPSTLASWMSDTLSHGVEAFVSIVPNALAKHAAIGALQTVVENYGADGSRGRFERLMEAGYLGGVAASNCSVGVVHAFAHSIARYDVPHGLGNALGLAAGIAVNADTSEMQELIRRMGLMSSGELSESIAPITSTALSSGLSADARAALNSSSERDVLARAMAGDVSLRTNPRRLDHRALMSFLDHVAEVALRS